MVQQRIGFIGAGNMASAIIERLVARPGADPKQIRASDPSADTRNRLAQRSGIECTEDNRALAQWSQVIVLAVKPQMVEGVLSDAAAEFTRAHTLVSICAGVSIEKLRRMSGDDVALVRAMPNTPAMVGEGVTAVSFGNGVSASAKEVVLDMFSAVGDCVQLEEHYMNAVTGLSGSGPAYIMLVVEALADGGVKAGLPRDVALRLAIGTVVGSGQLLRKTGKHPGQLKDQVTSPAGTTIEGVFALEQGGLRSALINAVVQATRRARELG